MKKRGTQYTPVLQSETKRFPTLGLYHWDVSDSHNIEMAGESLFCFDADFGNAPVFHALKLTEGGGATETVATRGDAVVIEEIRLALEVDGAAVDGKRARRLVGDTTFIMPRAVDALCR